MPEAVHQPPTGPRMKGTVKWFSNKKCFGFITPGDPIGGDDSAQAEDVFVHQSSIESEGFRTLREGWVVEFTLGTDESGRAKAERVTAPGGGPCTGPPRTSSHRSSGGGGGSGNVARDENGGGEGHSRGSRRSSRNKHRDRDSGVRRAPQPFWHESLTESVKSALDAKGISTKSGTIDIAVGDARIKLGTGGYSSMAHADGIVAEGSFECNPDGHATFKWERSIIFQGGQWNDYDAAGSQDLVWSVELALDDVGAVGPDETALTLWGDTPTDPKDTLEAKGFLMRRVVLTTPKSNRRGGR